MLTHFTLSLVVGAVAGALDAIPVLTQRGSFRGAVTAFLTYLFAAVIIFYSDLPYLPWWADGMGITVMMILPNLFVFAGKERRSIPFVLLNALLLGFLISVAERYLA